VHFQHVLVLEMGLDLDLPPKLVFHVRLGQLLLVKHFQCYKVFGLFFPSEVDVTEFASAQRFSNLKSFDAPVVGLELNSLDFFLLMWSFHFVWPALLNIGNDRTERSFGYSHFVQSQEVFHRPG